MSDTSETVGDRANVPHTLPALCVRLKVAAGAGTVAVETTQLVTLIGGRRDCHLPVNDPEVSKVHCAVVQTGHGLLVCDLCTRTGTFVNGTPVRVAPLAAGDTLRVGPVDVAMEFLSATTATPAAQSGPPPSIEIRFGGQAFDLAQTAIVVGRRTKCDLVLDTPDVSLAHALVFAYRGQPVVFDLGSRSGTLVNARRIRLAPLRNGDRLGIGGVTLVVECSVIGEADAAGALPVVVADDAAISSAAPARSAPDQDPHQLEQSHRAARGDLAAAQQQLDRRTQELDRRAAELDTLSNLLALESEHLERVKADLARRAADIEQAEKEAQERLALAIAHEQAVTAAWEELDRWHARHRTGRAKSAASTPRAVPAGPANGEPRAFTDVAQPYPPAGTGPSGNV